jgi:DNA (cytosine-5)-methyltransferase 1
MPPSTLLPVMPSEPLTVGSTFTGIGGADLGFEAAGFRIAWQCELDAWKRSVLAAHWPSIPIYEDVARLCVEDWVDNPEPVDVMIGGFPCQDLSIAGKRKGFSGERSVLAFEFLRVAETLKPRWLVLENVPGLLSSNKGLDFQRLLSEVAACGYGVGYRCLDARYFGVPQRRRRIFIVARRAEAGVDPRTASGLALRALCESGSGDTTPCIPPWQETPADAGGSVDEGGIFNATASFGQWVEEAKARELSQRDYKSPNHLVSFYPTGGSQNGFWSTDGVSPTVKVGSGVGASNGMAIAFGHTQGIDIQPSSEVTPTLRVGGGGGAVAFRKSARVRSDDTPETWVDDGIANTLNTFDVGDVRTTHAIVESAVRRLTPLECERLMGLPDHFTAPEGIKAPDSRRYAACGDAIVANVAFWIANRINMIEGEA